METFQEEFVVFELCGFKGTVVKDADDEIVDTARCESQREKRES